MAKEEEHNNERPKEIDAEVYKRGIALATPSQPSKSTSTTKAERHDALQPVSALGAFPLVRSSRPSDLPVLIKGIHTKTAIYCGIWAILATLLLPTLRALLIISTGALLVIFHLHHSVRKLQVHQEEEEAARFGARSEAIQEASLPESVEWLNALIEGIWPRIPAETFSSVADELEDVIQAKLPTFITEVKCAELTQGKNPMKVLSSRLLPPSKEDIEEAKWNGGVKKHIELEVAFAYRAIGSRKGISSPTKENTRKIESDGDLPETTSRGQDARILFLFQLKLGPTAIQLPVEVILNGLVGIAHLRLELTNTSPFLGDMALSFVGLPRVSLDIVPLKLSLAEIPGISGLIQSSVDAALEMYSMPKSLPLNLGEMLVGDGIKRDTDACGILIVTIHSAHELERSDVKGKGDPYARVNWSRASTVSTRVTRVILNDLNPIWEQTFALVVSPQVMAALHSTGMDEKNEQGESVCVELFDSDAGSQDDFLGRARWSLQEAMSVEKKGTMNRREDGLTGANSKEKRGGRVAWSVGYFAKAGIQDGQKNRETKDEKVEQGEEAESKPDDAVKPAVERIPPSKNPSLGILAIQIHGISSLRFKDATPDDALEEAPSSYVEVLLANRFIFKSRTKMNDGEPCFNAMTEQVCDWTTSSCVFVVRENKIAGKNAILGVVPIQLCDVFQKSSLVTDTYPMAGGIGSGVLRVSLLFRSLQLPKTLPRLPASVGLLTVSSLKVESIDSEAMELLRGASIELCTISVTAKLSSLRFRQVGDSSCEWEIHHPVKLPIYRREATALIIKIRTKKSKLLKKQTIAIAVLWLNQIDDEGGRDSNGTQTLELALWDVSNSKDARKRLERNWTSIKERDEAKIGLKLRGSVQVQLDFYTGVTRLHSKTNKLASDSLKVYEAWRVIEEAGLGDRYQNKELEDDASDRDVESNSDDDSSGDGEEGGDDEKENDALQPSKKKNKKRQMNAHSGSRGQLVDRFIRRGDYETASLKDEVRAGFHHFTNRFHTDNDKSGGVETEV